MSHIREKGAEIPFVASDAADGETAETHAVIAFGSPYEFGAPDIPAGAMIPAGDLERGGWA